jgi:hypothetical protein
MRGVNRILPSLALVLLAGNLITAARACIATQSVATRIPPELAAALEGANSLTISRHWWGQTDNPPLRWQPFTAVVSGADKKMLVAAIKAVGDSQALNGVRQMARLGYPVQPYRIAAVHQGKTHVLTICFECFDRKTAIGKYDGLRLSLDGKAKVKLARLVTRQGKPSAPSDAAELKEIAEVRAAAKAKADADKRQANAGTRAAVVGNAVKGPIPQARGAATGCGGGAGW